MEKTKKLKSKLFRRKIKTVPVIPTLITLGNMWCGFMSLYMIYRGDIFLATIFIFLAMICDGLDGKMARLTGGVSLFGKELDSIADIVSFGIAPAYISLSLVDDQHVKLGIILAFLYTGCVALRLARYNIEASSGKFFWGLPSPGAAALIASWLLLYSKYEYWWLKNIIMGLLVIAGALMVSRFKYLHLGNVLLKKRRPITFIIEILFVAILIIISPSFTLTISSSLYALSGPIVSYKKIAKKIEEIIPGTFGTSEIESNET